MKGKKEPDNRVFSRIYGGNIYTVTNEYVEDPLTMHNPKLSVQEGEVAKVPILTKQGLNEGNPLKFVVHFLSRENSIYDVRYEKYIKNPPPSQSFRWPVDMVFFTPEMEKRNPHIKAGYGLLFKYEKNRNERTVKEVIASDFREEYLGANTAEELLKPLKVSLALTKRVAGIVKELNDAGYYLGALDLYDFLKQAPRENEQENDEESLVLNFSEKIYSFKDYMTNPAVCRTPEELQLEFMDPSLILKSMEGDKETYFDFDGQNYSLCAAIFYILFNRHAYDGKMADGKNLYRKAQDDLVNDKVMKDMCKLGAVTFVFDPLNAENELSEVFNDSKILVDLWKKYVDDEVKRVFTLTLEKENVLRQKEDFIHYPTAELWITDILPILDELEN